MKYRVYIELLVQHFLPSCTDHYASKCVPRKISKFHIPRKKKSTLHSFLSPFPQTRDLQTRKIRMVPTCNLESARPNLLDRRGYHCVNRQARVIGYTYSVIEYRYLLGNRVHLLGNRVYLLGNRVYRKPTE